MRCYLKRSPKSSIEMELNWDTGCNPPQIPSPQKFEKIQLWSWIRISLFGSITVQTRTMNANHPNYWKLWSSLNSRSDLCDSGSSQVKVSIYNEVFQSLSCEIHLRGRGRGSGQLSIFSHMGWLFKALNIQENNSTC